MASANTDEIALKPCAELGLGGVPVTFERASGKRRLRMSVLAILACVAAFSIAFAIMAPQSAEAATSGTQTAVKVGSARFTMKLAKNDAAKAFRAYLSKARTFKMKELNGNEKYRYLSRSFPAAPKKLNQIKAGDVMLYGDDCLVIFYKTHETSYEYTKIGRLTSAKGLAKAAGKKSVKVRFSKMKQGG